MKNLKSAEDKVQQICHALRQETLEPAKLEAQRLIAEAEEERERLLRQAEQEAESIISKARKRMLQEKEVLDTSLRQAAKQSMESLRQKIEKHLFNDQLDTFIKEHLASPKVVAEFIDAIVEAISKEGLDADLEVLVPKAVKTKEISALLADKTLKKLKDHPIRVSDFAGGTQVKLHGKQMTIDLSENAIKQLMTSFLREDFRTLFFQNEGE